MAEDHDYIIHVPKVLENKNCAFWRSVIRFPIVMEPEIIQTSRGPEIQVIEFTRDVFAQRLQELVDTVDEHTMGHRLSNPETRDMASLYIESGDVGRYRMRIVHAQMLNFVENDTASASRILDQFLMFESQTYPVSAIRNQNRDMHLMVIQECMRRRREIWNNSALKACLDWCKTTTYQPKDQDKIFAEVFYDITKAKRPASLVWGDLMKEDINK